MRAASQPKMLMENNIANKTGTKNAPHSCKSGLSRSNVSDVSYGLKNELTANRE